MRAAEAQAILAMRGRASMTIFRKDKKIRMTCHHCGATAEFTDGDESEARMRHHVRCMCSVTAPHHPEGCGQEGCTKGRPDA